jgi:ATP/maltotriose-dependent transcriptional regulator MalT
MNIERVMAVRIEDRLSKEQRKQLERLKSPKKSEKRKKVPLSNRELEDLMGLNNRGLKRKKGGAWG